MKTRHTLEVPTKQLTTDDKGFEEIAGLVDKLVNSYPRQAFDLLPKFILKMFQKFILPKNE